MPPTLPALQAIARNKQLHRTRKKKKPEHESG
jgi:hypothetical protein